ncbi:MAG: hypothetical protein ACXQTP_02125 [Candidatus Methanofastidiosia archaeon]
MLIGEVVFATTLGMILLGETLDITGIIGATLMLISLVNAALGEKRDNIGI